MQRFTEKLIVSLEKDGKRWRLEAPFRYYSDVLGDRVWIEVPESFSTDFVSIPKSFLHFFSIEINSIRHQLSTIGFMSRG